MEDCTKVTRVWGVGLLMGRREKILALDSLSDFWALQRQSASLLNRFDSIVGTSLESNFAAFKKAIEIFTRDPRSDEFAAFNQDLIKLFDISQRIEALAESKMISGLPKGMSTIDVKLLRTTQKYEVKALNAFIEACELGIRWAFARQVVLLQNSGKTDEAILLTVGFLTKRGIYGNWTKKPAQNIKPLEAAMLRYFAQADKWWRISNKGNAILLKPRW